MMIRILVILALLIGGGGVWAQQGDRLPPRVIDVFPPLGAEVPADLPIQVIFDQPMNRVQVETSFSVTPTVALGFVWENDRTLRFLPSAGWEPGRIYQVTVGGESQRGAALESPFIFSVRGVGALAVSLTVPTPDAVDIDISSQIVVSFNRPVAGLGTTEAMAALPSPLRIEPDVVGTGEWVNSSIYAFTPAQHLAGGTEYRVTVDALRALDGGQMTEPYTFVFTTAFPRIVNVSPVGEDGRRRPDDTVRIDFNQPMDRASVEAAFALRSEDGIPVEGVFEWSEDGSGMIFRPSALLALNTVYRYTLSRDARAVFGSAELGEDFSGIFETMGAPTVIDVTPARGAQGVFGDMYNQYRSQVRLRFSTVMDEESLLSRVRILPAVDSLNVLLNISRGQSVLVLSFVPRQNTVYVVSIDEGAHDIFGNPMQAAYSTWFRTGEPSPRVYPAISSSFMITSAHRQDTRMAMVVTGETSVGVELYRIDRQTAGVERFRSYNSFDYPYRRSIDETDDASRPYGMTVDDAQRIWHVRLTSEGEALAAQEVLLASEAGGQLAPGLYWVRMESPHIVGYTYGGDASSFVLAVATANLTVKRLPDGALVWVTDMVTGEPMAGVNVQIDRAGELAAEGVTGADGVVRLTLDETDVETGSVLVTAAAEGVFGAWYSTGALDLPTERGYLYTDRPLYRPGEPVYFRGVLRDRLDMEYSLPDIESVRVRVQRFNDAPIFDEMLPITSFGTFSGTVMLPNDADLGTYSIQVDWGSGAFSRTDCYYYAADDYECYDNERDNSISFQVQEFRVPDYIVEVTAQQNAVLPTAPLNVLLNGAYYAGGNVSGAQVGWLANVRTSSFPYRGEGGYTFSDETISRRDFAYTLADEERAPTTDFQGNALWSAAGVTWNLPVPVTVTVEGTLIEEGSAAVSERAYVLVHSSMAYVGVNMSASLAREGEAVTANVIAVTPDSEPIAGQMVEAVLSEIRWERVTHPETGRRRWEQREYPIETTQVITGADGTATYAFTPPRPGIFRVRVVTHDVDGRQSSATARTWVYGADRAARRGVYFGPAGDSVTVMTTRSPYEVGETAEIFIPVPYDGGATVLITVERAGVMFHDVVRTDENLLLYELPITADFMPNVHVNVVIVKGIDADTPNPVYATGRTILFVRPTAQRLTVELTPSSRSVAPGEMLTVDVRVTDADGQPVRAEVGLALTDKAVLSLMPSNSESLVQTFYGQQRNYVGTTIALSALLDVLTDGVLPPDGMGGGGGGGGNIEIPIRDEFVYTPLWSPSVMTDEQGRASVSLTMPDNLTLWALRAHVVTAETQVGEIATEIVSALPLIIRPSAPRFFVVGDRVELSAVIQNNSDRDQEVEARLEVSGITLAEGAAQRVTLPAGDSVRVRWSGVVEDVPGVDMTFYALGEDGTGDAAKPALRTGEGGLIPVYRYTARDTVGTAGALLDAGTRLEGVSVPPRYADVQGTLTLRLDGSLAAAAAESFTFLREYRHYGIEQTVSRFYPNTLTLQALERLGMDAPALRAELEMALSAALEKMKSEQNADGGWGWFYGLNSDPNTTAYALLGLHAAAQLEENGMRGDSSMMDAAIRYINRTLLDMQTQHAPWQYNREAFLLYALAEVNQPVESERFEHLVRVRVRMSLSARAYLLMAIMRAEPANPLIGTLVSDLNDAALLSAAGAHWEEDRLDWRNWGSTIRSTAVILSALTRHDAANPILPNAVRWLMAARRGDHWRTTQDTVWVTVALAEWMVTTGELNGNYRFSAQVNSGVALNGRVTPETVQERRELAVDVAELLRDDVNRLTIARGDGTGALYYSAFIDWRLPAEQVEPASSGISVSREYLDAQGNPINTARVGDIVTIRLTLTLPEDIYYLVLEDPLPAGLESIDPRLAASSAAANAPTLRRENARYFWGQSAFRRTELRDELTALYAEYMRAGTYVYSVQARALTTGEFRALPAQAYAFYNPDVFGRSAGAVFTVTSAADSAAS